jgi:predicted permease
VAAILTLALGIGASTAVFSVVDAVLLRPLPYPEADRLVAMTSLRRGDEISISYPDFMDLRERTGTLASLAAYAGSSFTLTGEGQAERLRGQFVTAALFDVLRIAPVRGRVFTEEEDRPGGGRIALIGHAVWQRRFGGATDIVGRVIRLNGEPFTIVGVMPAGFDFPGGIVYGPAEVWVPAGLRSADWSNRDQHPGLYAVGRLRDGIALDAARADLTSIAAQLEQEYPMSNRDIGVDARSALDMLVGPTRPALLALLGAVALILVIACVNVASLLLVRTTARSGETRLRAALGATRARPLPRACCSHWRAARSVCSWRGGSRRRAER